VTTDSATLPGSRGGIRLAVLLVAFALRLCSVVGTLFYVGTLIHIGTLVHIGALVRVGTLINVGALLGILVVFGFVAICLIVTDVAHCTGGIGGWPNDLALKLRRSAACRAGIRWLGGLRCQYCR